jgi:hypothetical protein
MRAFVLFCLIVLSALSADIARASAGYSCSAKDANAKFTVSGTFSMGLGGGIANFGGDIEIFDKAAPERLQRIWLDLDHLGQSWSYHRDIKLMARWQSPEEEPFAEVILIIETRRGEAEDSPYVGSFELLIEAAAPGNSTDSYRLEIRGDATCSIG